MSDEPNRFIELRQASVSAVDKLQRIIDLVAAPYNEETYVEFRGEVWRESIEPGAFDGVTDQVGRIPVNRDHDLSRLVGKVVGIDTSSSERFLTQVRVSETLLGDETLALADDDVLGASVEMVTSPAWQTMNRAAMTKRVRRALLGGIGLTPTPAYEGARVLAVRSESALPPPPDEPLIAPAGDEALTFIEAVRARKAERSG